MPIMQIIQRPLATLSFLVNTKRVVDFILCLFCVYCVMFPVVVLGVSCQRLESTFKCPSCGLHTSATAFPHCSAILTVETGPGSVQISGS